MGRDGCDVDGSGDGGDGLYLFQSSLSVDSAVAGASLFFSFEGLVLHSVSYCAPFITVISAYLPNFFFSVIPRFSSISNTTVRNGGITISVKEHACKIALRI